MTAPGEVGRVNGSRSWARTGRVHQSPVKRAIDLTCALGGLLVTLPLWPIVTLAIKLEDRGPIFYRQRRWGIGGSIFEVLKFRTMVKDSDHLHGIRQATKDDERVTHVGRLLRSTGIDELPQFLNIVRGEMSFVGPRALAVGELLHDRDGGVIAYEDVPRFGERLAVRPGLTGMATVYLPKDAPPLEKLTMDLEYVRTQSVRLDLRLIALSVWISVRGGWEKRGRKY